MKVDFKITKNPITGKIEYIGTPIETIQSLDELIFDDKKIQPTDVITKGRWNYLVYEVIDLKEKLRQENKEAKCCFCGNIMGALIKLHQGWCCTKCFKEVILKG